MNILLIIFCFISIKSTLGMNGVASPQRLTYSRRRVLLPNQYQRVNPDVAKIIFLKQLLELESLRNIYLRNCQSGNQFIKRQKLPSTTRFNGMPAFRNNEIHPMTTSGVKRKYFLNPKIIILSPLTSSVETIDGNFQNRKGLNYKKKLPQHLGTEPENGEKPKTAEEKEESLRKEDTQPALAKAKNPVTKDSLLEESKEATFDDVKFPRLPQHPSPIEPSTDNYPKTTPNLFSILKSSPTQIYEVEEIIEGTVNVDEENFKKMRLGERTYFGNNIESISSENQENKVLGNSIMTIIKGMTESVTNPPPPEKILKGVSAGISSKAPLAQTTAPTQFQHFFRVLPTDATKATTKKTIIPLKTTPTVKDYPSHRITQHPDWFPSKKVDNEQGTLKPGNKIPKTFEVSPSVTTGHLNHGISDKEKTQNTETKNLESTPKTLFGLFNKESSENSGQKPESVPGKINLKDMFTLSSAPSRVFGNISDGNLQHLLRNLKVQDDLNSEKSKNEPPSSTTQSFSQTVTISVQIDNATLIPFSRAMSAHTPSMSEPDKTITGEETTTTLRLAPGRKGIPLTTSSSVGFNSDPGMSNLKELSDGPLTIDLLSSTSKPELKKDQEPNGKNSRKMHFNQDTQKGTTFNEITESSDTLPRRSDILITDYTDDYKDNENRFSNPSYLDRIKPNDTAQADEFLRNVKVDSFIPLIPEIINDIRENKISPQDLSLLSIVFGKHWSNVLAMSNNTELDVLPLLTMKTENDLISFMEKHFSNESKTSTTETDEVNIEGRGSSEQSYDYNNAYEDLYDYVLGQVREKRKRYRHKRDDELEFQKLEANKEYFDSLEEEQRNGKIEYMVEYAMYDESLEDENLSVLELIKPADLYINIKNETFREEQNWN